MPYRQQGRCSRPSAQATTRSRGLGGASFRRSTRGDHQNPRSRRRIRFARRRAATPSQRPSDRPAVRARPKWRISPRPDPPEVARSGPRRTGLLPASERWRLSTLGPEISTRASSTNTFVAPGSIVGHRAVATSVSVVAGAEQAAIVAAVFSATALPTASAVAGGRTACPSCSIVQFPEVPGHATRPSLSAIALPPTGACHVSARAIEATSARADAMTPNSPTLQYSTRLIGFSAYRLGASGTRRASLTLPSRSSARSARALATTILLRLNPSSRATNAIWYRQPTGRSPGPHHRAGLGYLRGVCP